MKNKRWPRATLKGKKREMAKGQGKQKEIKKRKEAKGLSKKKQRERQKRVQSAQVCQRHKKKKVRCSMFVGLGFIVLHAYVVITCSYHWSLTTIHHSPFMISLPSKPQSPLDLIVPCIIMGGELRATTSLW